MDTKLVMAIVQDDDANSLANALRDEGFSSTKISSTGGFLRKGSSTFLIGVDADQVAAVVSIMSRTCHTRTHLVNPMLFMDPEYCMTEPMEVQVGGAVIMVLDLESLIRV